MSNQFHERKNLVYLQLTVRKANTSGLNSSLPLHALIQCMLNILHVIYSKLNKLASKDRTFDANLQAPKDRRVDHCTNILIMSRKSPQCIKSVANNRYELNQHANNANVPSLTCLTAASCQCI